jgi:hypothetical protein
MVTSRRTSVNYQGQRVKIEVIRSSEMLVMIYQAAWHQSHKTVMFIICKVMNWLWAG